MPYGVMVPKGSVENLLVAGKCVSADEDAVSGVLCSGICMAMGEAAGTACAISIREDTALRDIEVKKVQEALVAKGAILNPEPVPQIEEYPVYENPLKDNPGLLEKYM